jgi:hypothetical protein
MSETFRKLVEKIPPARLSDIGDTEFSEKAYKFLLSLAEASDEDGCVRIFDKEKGEMETITLQITKLQEMTGEVQ